MNKYDRMLHILNLLRSRKNMNAQKLAEECGVTERSIYRDIISLSEMNVPIYYENGYKLASDNFLPPLNFNLNEYQLLRLTLESSPLLQTDKYAEVYRSLIGKVEGCLSDQVRREKKLSAPTTRVDIAVTDDHKRGELFYARLEKAISNDQRILLKYESISSGCTERKVDPYFIIFRANAFYFVGYCHKKKGFRTFRISRVQDVKILEETFIKDNDIQPEKYFEGSWQIFIGEPVEVVVIFRDAAAKVVAGSTHHHNERKEKLTDGRLKFSVVTRGLDEIQRWIIGFGEQAEVIAPTELKQNLKRIGKYLNSQYR